jgi:uncharacterized MnhB-related membrane protein
MLDWLLVIAAVVCAYQVMRAQRLILATLWLASTSALVATLLYRLGAPEVAVMELSVGAGLVTVLFVFAFSIVGEVTLDPRGIVPRPLVWAMILAVVLLMGWFILPLTSSQNLVVQVPFSATLWDKRGLDVLAQIVLIFSGAIGLLGLLAEREIVPGVKPRPTVALTSGSSQPEILEGKWQITANEKSKEEN